ncbi:MAG: LysM peptidoglycan-binding domain-containing protein [Lachnospiraceae bacterium]|nr:LysM peptidoglycan-binding domain-containing protein [Lachnospiraceae bacterium]
MKKYLLVLIVCVMILSCFFGKTLVMASEEENSSSRERYYTEIRIEKGDTLWSIARTYNKNSGMEIREYIHILKEINRLSSDEIEAGNCLTIVYFPDTVSGK